MESNPYETPRTEELVRVDDRRARTGGTGDFDVGVCLSEGWEATKRNLGVLAAACVLFPVLSLVCYFTVLGFFFVLPVLWWGAVRLCVQAHDDRAELGTLFSGFSNYGDALARMFGVGFLSFVVGLPGSVVMFYGAFRDELPVYRIGVLISFVWSMVVGIRFHFAWLFAVDDDRPAVQAMGMSWVVTGRVWLKLVLLLFVVFAVNCLAMLTLGLGFLVTVPLTAMMFVSAYRQMVGRPQPVEPA
ncbi:MAG: hypothetical protein R3F34_13935 [Planctomycetota bacterium]